MARKTHKDVEFQIGGESFRKSEEAIVHAFNLALTTGQTVYIDVIVWSKAGARFLYGDDGVEMYKEDPEASVFERIAVTASSLGRIA